MKKDVRFVFGDDHIGLTHAYEMPCIEIDFFPVELGISTASHVWRYRNGNGEDPASVEIGIIWEHHSLPIFVQYLGKWNIPEIINNLSLNLILKARFSDWIAKVTTGEHLNPLWINPNGIYENQIPSSLLPFFAQIRIWQEFFDKHFLIFDRYGIHDQLRQFPNYKVYTLLPGAFEFPPEITDDFVPFNPQRFTISFQRQLELVEAGKYKIYFSHHGLNLLFGYGTGLLSPKQAEYLKCSEALSSLLAEHPKTHTPEDRKKSIEKSLSSKQAEITEIRKRDELKYQILKIIAIASQ